MEKKINQKLPQLWYHNSVASAHALDIHANFANFFFFYSRNHCGKGGKKSSENNDRTEERDYMKA